MRHDLKRVLFHESTILARLDELSQRIEQDYSGKDLTVIAVMNGSLMFMADLLRRVALPLKIDFLTVSSYHGGTSSSGKVTFKQEALQDIEGRHLLILDDILDSGLTLHAIKTRLLETGKPLSVKVCVLLQKKRPREQHVEVDYAGFEIEDEFVVGYGLDYQERYRNLPLIGVLDERAI